MSQGITITINAETQEAAAQLKDFFGNINEGLNKLTQAGEFMRGVAVKFAEAFTLGAIVEEFKKAIDSAVELGHTVEKTGLAVQTLNSLKILGQENGIDFQEMTNALTIFNDRIFQAIQLGGAAARPFHDLGVAFTDAHGRALPMEAILRRVMDAFKAMPDGPRKVADAMELFGRIARELIPTLNQGGDAIDRFKESPGAFTSEMIDNARQFHVAMVDLGNAFHGIFVEASKEILPVLISMTGQLNDAQKAAQGTQKASSDLVEIFKVVATAGGAIYVTFRSFGEAVGFTLMELETFVEFIWSEFKTAVEAVKTAASNLGSSFRLLGQVASETIRGHFTDAKNDVERIASLMGGSVERAWNLASVQTVGHVKNMTLQMKAMLDQTSTDFINLSTGWKKSLDAMWGSKSSGGQASTGGAQADKSGASPLSADPAIISDEGKKLIDEVDKAWREATMTKMQILDDEEMQLRAKLQTEIHDEEKAAAETLKVEELYNRKRRELRDKETEESHKRIDQGLKVKQEGVEQDDGLTTMQKEAQMIPIIQARLAVEQRMYDLEKARSTDPKLNEEQKLNAEKQMNAVLAEQQKLRQKLDELQSHNFIDTMRNGLRQFQNDFQNLGQNLAGGALNGVKLAIDGVTQGIMGAIEGTKTWGQVFLEVGRSIVASIIQIVVQWIAQMTIIALLKKLFGQQDKDEAAQTATSWAPAAIAASIASFGSASAIGGAAFATALVAGTALASGLSGAGFETGGIVQGGPQMIRVNEKGKEAVMNAHALEYWGEDFFNGINAGVRDVYQLPGVGGSGRGGGGSGGSSGNVNVQGHKMSVAFVNSKNEMRDFLSSEEGHKMVVDIARKRRLDIGIGT